MNAAIARHLNVTEAAIVKVEEWANVLFCVVRGIGARFVSKKAVKMNAEVTKDELVKKMESIGGSRWTKGNHDRMYFHGSVVSKLLGLSNSKSRQINSAKFYYDLNTGKFVQKCSARCLGVTDAATIGKNRHPYWVEAINKAIN